MPTTPSSRSGPLSLSSTTLSTQSISHPALHVLFIWCSEVLLHLLVYHIRIVNTRTSYLCFSRQKRQELRAGIWSSGGTIRAKSVGDRIATDRSMEQRGNLLHSRHIQADNSVHKCSRGSLYGSWLCTGLQNKSSEQIDSDIKVDDWEDFCRELILRIQLYLKYCLILSQIA